MLGRPPKQRNGADTYRPILIDGKRVASSEYNSWQMMKNRCLNPNSQDYNYYGGRGIVIDPRWLSFDEFINDMGPKDNPKLTLERRDNNLGYNKSNCYWGTRLEQARNRNFLKTYKGKYVWEWAQELGIKPMSFHMRLWKLQNGEITEAQLFESANYSRNKKAAPNFSGKRIVL